MTANTTGEKYREQFEKETGNYLRLDEGGDFEVLRRYRVWLESALAQSQKEAGELRDERESLYVTGYLTGANPDGDEDPNYKKNVQQARERFIALAALTQKEKT